jgi:hypothetical protein
LTEGDLLKRLQRLSTGDVRLWRNNVGRLQTADGRWVQYGLAPGSSDLIGLQSIIITQDMVGARIARFVAIEAKSERGRIMPAQRYFLEVVDNLGGLSAIVRTEDEARELLRL